MGRYVERVKGRVWFLTTIASATLAPTVAEITAGVRLSDPTSTNPLKEVDGFKSSASFVETPFYGAAQTPKISGEIQLADSGVIYYRDETTNPLDATLADNVKGYFVFAGPGSSVAAGLKVDVYPSEVAGNNPERNSGNEAATSRADVAISNIPAKQIAVLA